MKKIIIEIIVISAISIVFGFVNNAVNPNRVLVSTQRPVAEAADNAVIADSTESLQHPIVVDKQQVKRLIKEEAAVLLDARLPEEYKAGHMPGAINVPVEMLGEFIDKIEALPKDAWVISYCDGPPCDKGKMLADELFYMDFTRVAYYDAGMDDWKKTEEVER